MGRHWMYLKYVVRHKWFVFLAGMKMNVNPWSLLWHDWSKFLPSEWFPYARYFYKPDGSKRGKDEAVEDWVADAFDVAWNSHQKRHKHHFQYWILQKDDGGIKCLLIPSEHRREMVADWMGAGRALGLPDTKNWYLRNYHNVLLHPLTREWVDVQLGVTKHELEVLNI